ncbi:MAG TPA: 50S ribosomal protein L18e [Candidatus Bilamarchaeum sp.]|nr:50S ribosomal protein L18e [Candidatus Bilamarchaeum sp.]
MKKKDNQVLSSLIENLSKTDKPIWKKVAGELSKPRRKRVEVNLSKIEAYAEPDSTILVPGKVLGAGSVSKKMNVAAYAFSEKARAIISAAGGKAMTIESLHKSNPDGKGVLILK